MSDRPLDLDDIQGDVLGGFNTDVQLLVGLALQDSRQFTAAVAWLSTLSGAVTSVSQVRGGRDDAKQLSAPPPVWLSVALSADLLRAAAPDVFVLDDAFNEGMAPRAPSALADRSDNSTWTAGALTAPIDILLKIAANVESAVEARTNELIAAAEKAGLRLTYREVGRRLTGSAEHFGFRDGVSQPDVLGDGTQIGIAAGHFVFGYPRRANSPPPQFAQDPRNVTDNGSLLVFRRLAQDVGEFRSFCKAERDRLQQSWPDLSEEWLAALIVGRWPSGAPSHPIFGHDPGVVNDTPDNSFDFFSDDKGLACPFGAHIRKVNPRKGSSDVVDVPRLLRRGIPFGPPYDIDPQRERGLLFLAYHSSIQRGFEFISSMWMNSDDRPGPGDDVLIGRPFDSRSMTINRINGNVSIATTGRQWIHPTGGAYLFAPGKRGLAMLGSAPSQMAQFSPSLLLARAASGFRLVARRLRR